MAKRWDKNEENKLRNELVKLYEVKNKTIEEISKILDIGQSTVFQRMNRLGIKSNPETKKNYLNRRTDVYLPTKYNEDIAEFFGIMFGDGHISHFQTIVSLGNKEKGYAEHVVMLIRKVFIAKPKISIRKKGYLDVYLGSTQLTRWLKDQGLVSNKVKEQVDIPNWIFSRKKYMKKFIRGFFDTDGSVYKLKFGVQISFTNYSFPLLLSLHRILFELGYKPSEITSHSIYLTRNSDVSRFFTEIKPKNRKHKFRFKCF